MKEEQVKWINAFMSQNVSASTGQDYTRIVLNCAFFDLNIFNYKIAKDDLSKYVYRFYADNKYFASINPSLMIKNIIHFVPSDLNEYIKEEIMLWNSNSEFKIQMDDNYYWVNETCIIDSEFIDNYNTIMSLLFNKYNNSDFKIESKKYEINRNWVNQEYLNYNKHSYLLNRALETMKYCVLCDEYKIEALNFVHIKDFKQCNDNELHDLENTLVLCDLHSELYLNKCFNFNTQGYIEIKTNNTLLDNRMHINMTLLTDIRKKYIKESY